MSGNSVEIFKRAVLAKHQAVIAKSNELLSIFSEEDVAAKKQIAQTLLGTLLDLQGYLSATDQPIWLSSLISWLRAYVGGQWNAGTLLSQFVTVKLALESHKWEFDNAPDAAFDFDAIYEHFRRESRLPTLFDELIRILGEIHASGEVDSVSMMQALSKVIATMRKGRDGSYFAMHSAWEFLMIFLKNYMWAELSQLPVLGSLLAALRDTVSEVNEEMGTLHKRMEAEMTATVGSAIGKLKGKSDFQFIGYSKDGYVLPEAPGNTLRIAG